MPILVPPDRLAHGLRGHLNRFSHVVINVSDLDRAVEFYEAVYPVRRVARLNGPAQCFDALGIAHGRFEGWVLDSVKDLPPAGLFASFPGRQVWLVQWRTPRPVGVPYREANHIGIYRQNALVPDLNAAYTNVLAQGGRPYGEPQPIVVGADGFAVESFGFRDPDGITLELMAVTAPDNGLPYPGALQHCNLNVRDLARSFRFYHDVIGLDPMAFLEPPAQPPTNGALGDLLRDVDGTAYRGEAMRFKAVLLSYRSDTRTPLDVLEWQLPRPCGTAYAQAQHVGIVRVAFEVDDLDASCARLLAAGVAVSAIERWDLGESGRRRVAQLRDPDGIQLELVEQRRLPG